MTADASDYMMDDAPPSEPPSEPSPNLKLDSGQPANESAEATVLGACLLDPACYSEAAEKLRPEHFSLDSFQRIFRAMGDLLDANKALDLVTLAEELGRTKELATIGGVSTLAGLTEGLPFKPEIANYVAIIADKFMLRRIMSICNVAIQQAADQSESALSVLEYAEGELLQIAQEAVSGKLRTVADSVESAGGIDEYLKPILNPVAQTGLPTGFYDVDRLTGGLKKGELTIIAARPSMGKTALGINIAQNVALDSYGVVAVFSLEMTREALEKRMLASSGRVNVRRAMSGEFLSALEKEKLQGALGRLVESNIFIDDTPAMTPTQIRAKARRLKQKMGQLDLVLIDYLQLMTAGHKTESRRVEVEICSRSLKAMAKELDVPVVALAQVARSSEQRSDKRPMLADLRESGGIEQDADCVLFIHRESYYNRDEEQSQEDRAMAEIIVAKNREGPTDIARLLYMETCTLFMNLARG
jgi:replicative DNA helicase